MQIEHVIEIVSVCQGPIVMSMIISALKVLCYVTQAYS